MFNRTVSQCVLLSLEQLNYLTRIPTSKLGSLVCKHVQRNVSYHSDDSFDKIIVHWADITLLYMCIVNGK